LQHRSCILLFCALLPACASSDPDGQPNACDQGFATSVVSVTWGSNAGFGQDRMPGVVLGPPRGGGAQQGSTDVVSLGLGGSIVLSFAGLGIDDGPGPDFIVFENAFYASGDPSKPYAEPGQVSVSEDGVRWTEFPCKPSAFPYEGCAGWHAVLTSPDDGVSPFDPAVAGGEAFDLASVGMKRARLVRIQDRSTSGAGTSAGFDLDAIAVIHPACE
jgi:hypothetical protein